MYVCHMGGQDPAINLSKIFVWTSLICLPLMEKDKIGVATYL